MATFNFGIGIQVEGNGVDAVRDFTSALGGLNAAFQEISGSVPNFDDFTGAIDDASDAVDNAAGSIQESTDAYDESAEAREQLTGAIVEQTERTEEGTEANDEYARSAQEADEYIRELESDIRDLGGTSDRTSRGMSRSFSHAFERLGQELHQAGQNAVGMLESIQAIVTFGGASKIEDDLVRMNAQMGIGREGARGMMTNVLNMSDALKIPPELISQTAQAITKSGGSFAGLSDAAQETAAKMVGVFHIDPSAVGGAVTSAQIMGTSLDDLANTSAEIGKISKVPGLIEELPGALNFAREAQANFALTVGKSGKQITNDTQRMTALYSKALGKSAPEAARLAQETFNRFAKGIQQNADVFLGLADSFDPLTNAMLETGMSFEDAQDMMKMPTDGPEGQLAFIEQVQHMKDTMDPTVFQRFYRQLQTQGGEAINQLLTLDQKQIASAGDLKDAMEEKRKEQEDADPAIRAAHAQAAAFAEMSKSMRESVAGAAGKNQASMDLIVERLKMLTSGAVMDGLNKLADLFGKVAGWIEKIGKDYGPEIEKLGPIIAGVVVAAGAGAAAFSAFGTVLAPLQLLTRVVGGLGDAAVLLPRVLGSTGAAAEGAAASSGVLSGALGAVGTSALALGVIAAGAAPAAESMRELSDSSLMAKDSGEQMGTIYGSVLAGVLQTVDTLLGGLPSRLFGVTDGFNGVQTFVTDMFTGLPKKVEDGVAKFFGVITNPDNLTTVGLFFSKVVMNILDAIGHLPAAVLNIMQSAYNFITDMFGSITKGIMKAFGADGSSIETVNLFIDYLKFGFQMAFGTIRAGLNLMMEGFAKVAGFIPGLSDEQKVALSEFASARQAAVDADKKALSDMSANIETRKAHIDELALHERQVAAAGGEDAYRRNQQEKELHDQRVARGRALVNNPNLNENEALFYEREAQQKYQQQILAQHTATPSQAGSTSTQSAPPTTPEPVPKPHGGTITEPSRPSATEPPPRQGARDTAAPGTTSTSAPAATADRAGSVPPDRATSAGPATEPYKPAAQEIIVRLQVEVGRAATALERALNELSFRQVRTS